MDKNSKISIRQFTIIAAFYTIGSSILLVPSLLTLDAKQDAWIACLVTIGAGMLLIWLYSTLNKQFPNHTLVEFNEIIFGKIIGKLISLCYFFFFLLIAVLIINDIGSFLTTQMLIETPIHFIYALFLLIVIMGSRLGLEVIGRTAETFFP